MRFIFILFYLSLSVGLIAQGSVQTKDETSLSGFFNNTDFGLLVGSSKNNLKAPFSLMSVTSYQLDRHFSVGVGIGTDFLEETYIPLVLDIHYYLRENDFSPFVFVQGGYAISTEKEIEIAGSPVLWNLWPWPYQPATAKPKGGFLINPGLGIRKMFGHNFGVTFSVSYRYQRLDYDTDEASRLEVDYNRLNIRIGIIFK